MVKERLDLSRLTRRALADKWSQCLCGDRGGLYQPGELSTPLRSFGTVKGGVLPRLKVWVAARGLATRPRQGLDQAARLKARRWYFRCIPIGESVRRALLVLWETQMTHRSSESSRTVSGRVRPYRARLDFGTRKTTGASADAGPMRLKYPKAHGSRRFASRAQG